MKKEFVFLWLLFVCTGLKGQSFPQLNALPSWKVGVWSFWTGSCEAFHWKYGNATNLCGNPYIEVVECDNAGTNCTVRGYIRISGQQVYARKTSSCTETDRLMYDFGLASGSVYKMAYNLGTYDTTMAQITTTQAIAYQNISRVTQSITYTVDPPANNYTDYMNAIAGIGSDVHPFFPFTCFGDFCETNLQLLEYKENGTVLFSKIPVFPLPCTSWVGVGIQENLNSNSFGIFPNPAKSHITIKTDLAYEGITIVDFLSRVVWKQDKKSSDDTIDLSGLPDGVYFIELKLQGNNTTLRQKFVKG